MKKLFAIATGVSIVTVAIAILIIQTQTIENVVPTLQESSSANSKIMIIASFYPLYEFSRNIAGDKADVSSFIPLGIEPHDWEPNAGDILKLKEAKIFVYNGGGFEPYVQKLIDSGEYNNVIFVETVHGITLLKAEEHEEHFQEFLGEIEYILHELEEQKMNESDAIIAIQEIIHTHEHDEHEHDGLVEEIEYILHELEEKKLTEAEAIIQIHTVIEHGTHQEHSHDLEYDPHIWLDPLLAKQQVLVIKEALIKADPSNAVYYENNAIAYNAKLDALDLKIKSELSDCKKDTVVPFHNAFSYLAKRYGFNVFSLSGIAPESEASAAELKRLVDFVKENNIKVVFAEDLVDPRLAEVLAKEAGAQVMILSPLEGLSKEEIAAGKTYLTKMEENISNLKIALECQ
ncbi:MAG: zinc ABC transporter substrate-binding protein [Candidatus Nitrosotenuis sp.]|uniref:Putative Zinc-binding lipoprotein AdcA n=1 Tax=Candidatus Nitrosotenuis uzonensis TaxID=1407055 RepID=A0A812F0A6_9ARCH|nr:zinc ABC transporter substrate-binding protein [Candidatus Nitrosotenuis uzonensis]CAE6491943.1 putative Zinc-binding lipoprotein AdcA [Candidatus Nitrosotenuis uzonensis]